MMRRIANVAGLSAARPDHPNRRDWYSMLQRLRERLGLRRPAPPSEEKLSRRIARIEKDLHALAEQHETVVRQLRQVHGRTEALAELQADVHALTEHQDEVSRQLRRLQAGVDGL